MRIKAEEKQRRNAVQHKELEEAIGTYKLLNLQLQHAKLSESLQKLSEFEEVNDIPQLAIDVVVGKVSVQSSVSSLISV